MKISPNYQCPSCGATASSKVGDCCDYCVLSLFSGVHSPDLATAFENYKSLDEWVADTSTINYAEEAN